MSLAGREVFGPDYLRLFVALQNAAAGDLLFIQLNSPVRRKQLPEQLKADGLQRSFAIADFSTFQPGPPPYGVLREFLESLQPPSPEILFVDGLEYWIDAHPKPGGVLEELNLGRERLANLGVVVVFLFPVYLINLIRSHALNLWSWRAHHYVLTSNEEEERRHSMPPFLPGHIIAPGDTPEARERRIRILKRLLQEGLAEHRSLEALLRPILLPLARELSDAGHFAEALQMLAPLGDTLEAIEDAQQKVEVFILRGILLVALGNFAEAESFVQQVRSLEERAVPQDSLGFAKSVRNLAWLYLSQGKYAEAEPLYRQALAIYEKTLGAEHLDVGLILNNLAWLYYFQGKYAEAESFCQRALNIYKKTLGLGHPKVADSLTHLAFLYYLQGRYAEAEPLYRQALAIYEKTLGAEHPNVVAARENLAHLLRITERITKM